MNRFRTRRKAKGQQRSDSPSDPDFSLGLSFKSKSFSKNRHQAPPPEEDKVIDLSSALPSSNDFRTSLIMPNLSARFSMLREQDDPSTKIGKANDDSVLFPKRASRLNLFSHNPLTDIAEVDSICESIRPPFASRGRTHSFDTDGYDSDGGASMISRSRPGEGNNLFGGRQKLYKIPVDLSSKPIPGQDIPQPGSGSMSGRVMYENDVSLSLFQKHRERERDERRNGERRSSIDGADEESPHSPATSSRIYRGTTSSTNSAPRRDSTAATSIASQSPSLTHNNASTASTASTAAVSSPNPATSPKPPVDRNATVYRKLYGQALYQSNCLHRAAKDVFDNLNRSRPTVTDKKDSSVSPETNKPDQNESTSSSATPCPPPPLNFRSASPPPPSSPPGTMGFLDSALRDAKPLEAGRGPRYGIARPLSPPVSDGEDAATFVNSLQPEDRGKATAMGLFNKPCQDYDDQQFSQRQFQMHQERRTPILGKRSPSPASAPASPDTDLPEPKAETSSDNTSSAVEQTESYATSTPVSHKEEAASLEGQLAPMAMGRESQTFQSQGMVTGTTWLDDEVPSQQRDEDSPVTPSEEVLRDTHPAYRPVIDDFNEAPLHTPSEDIQTAVERRPVSAAIDDQGPSGTESSDIERPVEGLGLSGLIRTHLRHDSDKSSVYRPVSSRLTSNSVNESPKVGASSWNFHGGVEKEDPAPWTENQFKMARNAQQFLNEATLLKNRSKNRTEFPTEDRPASPNQGLDQNRTWQDELQSRHQRGGSTETQQEREAFNHELAERRKKVQEKLRDVVESSSRSVSPAPPSEESHAKAATGISALLRTKPSRNKTKNQQPAPPVPQDHSSKAMKVLGLGGRTSPKVASPGKPAQEELWKEEEERMLEAFGRRTKRTAATGSSPATKSMSPALARPSSSRTNQSDGGERSRQRYATPNMLRDSARERSASDLSTRSNLRNGPYRDDLDKAMAEGTGSHARIYGLSNASTISMASRPSIQIDEQPERSASAMSGRYRSNSRTAAPGYFDSKPVLPLQTSGLPSSASISTRPSPRTPYSAHSAHSAQSTPPIRECSPNISSSSMTTANPATDDRHTPGLRDRKRSITKNMISDPTFVSTTYSVSTVDLPPGASLRNGSDEVRQKDSSVPAVPLMNPARRRGRIGTGSSTTQTLISTITGRTNESKVDVTAPKSACIPTTEERSNFSDEGEEKKPSPVRIRHKLRKVSSEGGDMNSKARFQALMSGPSPALPTFPVKRGPSPTMQKIEGGMF